MSCRHRPFVSPERTILCKSLRGYVKADFVDAWRRYGVGPSLSPTSAPNRDGATSQVRGHEIGRGWSRGRGSSATEYPTWLFRCDRCGDQQEDMSTTRLANTRCYNTECDGKYRLVEEVA
jgi:hypothetical protein